MHHRETTLSGSALKVLAWVDGVADDRARGAVGHCGNKRLMVVSSDGPTLRSRFGARASRRSRPTLSWRSPCNRRWPVSPKAPPLAARDGPPGSSPLTPSETRAAAAPVRSRA